MQTTTPHQTTLETLRELSNAAFHAKQYATAMSTILDLLNLESEGAAVTGEADPNAVVASLQALQVDLDDAASKAGSILLRLEGGDMCAPSLGVSNTEPKFGLVGTSRLKSESDSL